MIAYSFYEADSRIRQYAAALIKRGDAVDVIALRRPDQEPRGTVEGVEVHRVQERVINERKATTYLTRILRFLIHAAALVTRLNFRRRYDLIHVHSVPDFLVFTALVPKLAGVPVVLDIHDILPEFYASKFGKDEGSMLFRLMTLVEKTSIGFSDSVIIANELWRERLVSRSVRSDKCITVCNHPDQELFVPQPHEPDGTFRILFPGSLNHHQGVDVAIRAFARIANRMPEAQFDIYGEGPDRPALEQLVTELGMRDRIKIRDYVSTAEVASIMAKADLAIVPKRASSKFGNEAASTKIMEFMAVGVPLIISRTKIDSFYFNDSVVRFFESENDADLAEAIFDLWSNPKLRARLVENATQFVAENCWDVKKRGYLELVDRLAFPKGRRSEAQVESSGVEPARK